MSVVEVRDEGAVRLVTFNRPEVLNAFDQHLYRGVAEALTAAAADDTVHAVVLTGAGRAFSAGQDLGEMAALAAGTAAPGAETGFRALLEVVQQFDKPLLAAVNGVGIGIGCTLLAHCDLVLVADSARLRTPFAELGVPPEAASSYLFPARLGWQRASLVLLAGEWVSGPQAVEWGLAVACHPVDVLLGETMALAARIAAAPLGALRAIKQAMLAAQLPQVVAARAREEDAFAALLGSAATRDALDRFETRRDS